MQMGIFPWLYQQASGNTLLAPTRWPLRLLCGSSLYLERGSWSWHRLYSTLQRASSYQWVPPGHIVKDRAGIHQVLDNLLNKGNQSESLCFEIARNLNELINDPDVKMASPKDESFGPQPWKSLSLHDALEGCINVVRESNHSLILNKFMSAANGAYIAPRCFCTRIFLHDTLDNLLKAHVQAK